MTSGTDPWEGVRKQEQKARSAEKRSPWMQQYLQDMHAVLTDADALLIFKGQAEAALEALEHGLKDAPEGILRDALAALPENLR